MTITTSNEEELCAYCKYYEWLDREHNNTLNSMGTCHRFPPKTGWRQLDEENEGEDLENYLVNTPGTTGDNWCGEFSKK